MNRHILFITNEVFLRQGGMERFNRHMCMALQRYTESRQLSLAILSKNDHTADERYVSNSKSTNFIGCQGSKAKFIYQYFKAITAQSNVKLCIFGIINHLPLVSMLPRRIKKVAIIHGFEAWEKFTPIKRNFLSHIDEYWSVSDYTKKEFIRLNEIAGSKVKLLSDALDYYWFEDNDQNYRDDKYILCVARLDAEHGHYKGVDDLIRSYSRVSRKYPEYKLVIAGNGSDADRLQQMAASEGVLEKVKFLNSIRDEELKRIYNECTIFALPSKKEGFGLVFLEAMAARKPVIGGKHGGTPEVIEDGKTGLLVTHGREEELTSALELLLSDRDLRLKMGEAGYRGLSNKYLYQNFESTLFSYLSALVN
jgi:phosphatidylinositol alpha-1,6-mannosyltransferase